MYMSMYVFPFCDTILAVILYICFNYESITYVRDVVKVS